VAKGEETRQAILARAFELANVVGVSGLSIGRLAEATGLSKSGLFAHFGSKEDLQAQVLQTAIERFAESVVRPALTRPRGEPRVRALFENWLAWAEATYLPGGCIFIATANELDDRPGPLRDLLVESQQRWLAVIARAARISQEEGHFRSDLDADQFAYGLYAVALAYHHFRRLLRDPGARDRARRAFEDLMRGARAAAA
jgi:AcrR family transcriptional regulator